MLKQVLNVYRTRLDALLCHMPAQLTLKVATVQHGVTTSQKNRKFLTAFMCFFPLLHIKLFLKC